MSATLPPDALGVPPHALGYHALKLWQRGLDLAADAHRLARAFPDADQPALAADLRPRGRERPGHDRRRRPGLRRTRPAARPARHRRRPRPFETLAALAERLGVLSTADATALLFTAGDVNRLLRGFVRSVSARTAAPSRTAPDTAPTPATTSALAVAERPASAQASAPTSAPTSAPPSMRGRRRRSVPTQAVTPAATTA
jgi:hypothetical protein